MTPIVQRNEGFNQVCVWPGTLCGADKAEEFEAFMKDELGCRVQYLEEVLTLPDLDDDDTGGRNDLIFAMHSDDIGAVAVQRLQMGIRWIEDVLNPANHNRHLYDCKRLDQYKTW